MLRDARPSDLNEIGAILNREIESGTASWRHVPLDNEALAAWFATRQSAGLPIIAAGEPLVGYGSFGPFRAGEGYRGIAEHSVYVSAEARGAGIGRALLEALMARARAAGLSHLVGGVSGDQPASLALHRSAGFAEAGRLPGIGQKAGRQLDLVLMLRAL
ncbi:MAG: N-acetyltransferase family protein [Pseudomonadota bacterium]